MSKHKSNQEIKTIAAKRSREIKEGERVLRARPPRLNAIRNPRLWEDLDFGAFRRVALPTSGC